MVGVSGDRQEMTIPAMQKLAKDYTTNAKQCAEIAQFLKSPLATMFWQSQAASSFPSSWGNTRPNGLVGPRVSVISCSARTANGSCW